MKKLVVVMLALMFCAAPKVAVVNMDSAYWLRCAFSGSCIPMVRAATTQTSTATTTSSPPTSKPKPTTTHPVIVNK